MSKRLPVFILLFVLFFLGFSFLHTPRALALDTTCQDGEDDGDKIGTIRLSGVVWESIVWGDRKASVGVGGVTLTVTRGDGRSVEITTGRRYVTNPDGSIKSIADLDVPFNPKNGTFDLCGFIYDAEYTHRDYRGNIDADYRPQANNGVPHINTIYSIRVKSVPAGFVNKSFTTFTPTYTLTRGNTIPDTRGNTGTVTAPSYNDMAYGAAAYVNQVSGSSGKPILRINAYPGGVVSCNSYSNTNGSVGVKYRCDFLINRGPMPVGGIVKSKTGSPIVGLRMLIYNDATKKTQEAYTDATGRYKLTNFVSTGNVYAARVDWNSLARLQYDKEPGTSMTTNSYDICKKSNTPAGSDTYECQAAGSNDCSAGTMRCDFVFTLKPTPTPTRVPTSTPTPVRKTWKFNASLVCPNGTAVTNAAYSVFSALNPNSGPTPPGSIWTTWPTSGSATSPKSYTYTNVVLPSGQYGYINVNALTSIEGLRPYGAPPNTQIQYSSTPYLSNTYVRWTSQLASGTYAVRFALSSAHPSCVTPTVRATVTPVLPTKTPTPTPIACEAKPADIVLILDRSSSIATNIEKEKAAAKQFIGGLSQTIGGSTGKIRVGVITYYKVSIIESGMVRIVPGSSELRGLYAEIDAIKYVDGQNGSCLKCAEDSANSLLAGSNATYKAVVMMTDGRANVTGPDERAEERAYPEVNKPMKEAVASGQAAAKAGIKYYAVGYGGTSRTRGDVISAITGDSQGIVKSNTTTDASETTTYEPYINANCAYPPTKFKNAASCRYDYEPDANQWASTFAEIGGEICPAYKNKILNYKVTTVQQSGGILDGIANFITSLLRSGSERTYAEY